MLNQLIDINNPKVLKVRDLKQHPRNPRKQNKEAMEFLEKSVEKLGSFRPLIINTKNEVLAGNQLLSILKKRKVEEIACLLPFKELTEEEEKAIIIADNQNSFYENSNKWDVEIVFNEFDVVLEEFKLDPVNFDLNMRDAKEPMNLSTDTRTNEAYDENLFQIKDSIFFNTTCKFGIPPLREDMLLDCEIDDICAKANQETEENKTYMVLYNQFAINEKYNNAIVGFFLHDHIFESVFNNPINTLQRLKDANIKGILTPNFSLWADEPNALQIYNWYKTQWTGRFYQESGIKVMPTLNWSDEDSYDFAFSGVPKYAKKVIVQCRNLKNEKEKIRFLKGLHEAYNKLEFEFVYIYGGNIPSSKSFLETNIPSYIKWDAVNSQTEKITELLKKKLDNSKK